MLHKQIEATGPASPFSHRWCAPIAGRCWRRLNPIRSFANP